MLEAARRKCTRADALSVDTKSKSHRENVETAKCEVSLKKHSFEKHRAARCIGQSAMLIDIDQDKRRNPFPA